MPNKLDKIIEKINNESKSRVVFRLGKDHQLVTPRITTGIPTFDAILGGGIPIGPGFVELYGMESGGKTLLACHITKQFQKVGHEVVYIDAENTLDLQRMIDIGVDMGKVAISQDSGAEPIMKMIKDFVASDEPPGLIVLDSVAALSPIDEQPDENTMGLMARILSRSLRNISAVNKSTMILFVNQIRDKIGPIPSQQSPGGHALYHWCKIRAEVRKGGWITESTAPEYKKHLSKGAKDVIGHEIKVRIVKNKTANPFGTTTLFYYLDGEIDVAQDSLTNWIGRGIITRSGPIYETPSGQKFKGREAIVDEIRAGKITSSTLSGGTKPDNGKPRKVS